MTPEPRTPRELARVLVGRRTARGDDREPSPATPRVVCERLFTELSRWVGTDGSYALFTRAMSTARAAHPALRCLVLNARADLLMEGLADAVHAYGETAVVDGLEAMLVVLIELLGLLIGDDMAVTLVLPALPSQDDAAATDSERTAL
jgi:hypothetical protein